MFKYNFLNVPNMSINIIDIILLLAASQGFFLTVLIFHKYRTFFANKILATLILIYSIVLLNLFLSEMGYYTQRPFIMAITMGFPFLIGPMHYLYVKYIFLNRESIKKTDFAHIIPFIICLLYFFPGLINSEMQIADLISSQSKGLYPRIFNVYNWMLIIQACLYVLFALLLLRRYARYIKDTFSSIEKIRLNWLKYLTYFIGFSLIVFALENILLLLDIEPAGLFNISSALIAVYVYALGYTGFLKSEIFTHPEISKSIDQIPKVSFSYLQDSRQDKVDPLSKYQKSGLSQEQAKTYLADLIEMMETKKPYQDSDLSLDQLAEMLSISPHNLSEVINVYLKQSFFDLVNNYRVEQVKKDLTNPAKNNLTFLSLAIDAGFNSKSTFNAIFKKLTGQTPSAFRNNNP